MGLLGGIGQTISNSVRNPGGFVENNRRNIMPWTTWFGGGSTPQPSHVDRGLSKIQRAQLKQAKEFQAGIPKLSQDLYTGVEGAERRRLAKNISGINEDASSRGLLYSGIRQTNEGEARAESAGNLFKAKTDINSQMQEQARQMQQDALKTGFDIQNQRQAIQDSIYNQALSNMANRRGLLGAFAGAGGTIAGSYAGGR